MLTAQIPVVNEKNFVLRKYLEQKAAEKTDDESEGDAVSDGPHYDDKCEPQGTASSEFCVEASSPSLPADTPRRFWPFSREKQNRTRPPDVSSAVVSDSNVSEENIEETRPAFKSELRGQSASSRKMVPRAVTIPYSRVKKDRFFDWPPDPFVSRATPMSFRQAPTSSQHPQLTSSPAREGEEVSKTISSSNSATELRDMPRGMRRRLVGADRYGVDQQSRLPQPENPELPRFI